MNRKRFLRLTGWYPAGAANPEASLSLLYPKYAGPAMLQGKTVPLATVEAILASGRLLGPASCGWHYVEGLTEADDPRLALLWDKISLGHNGQRQPQGGHHVIRVRPSHVNFVPESQWPAFLAEQADLLQKRAARQAEAGDEAQ